MIFPNFHTPQVMAIVNVTDDSFYSSSRAMTIESLEHRIAEVVAQGATIVDIGGCSTRPGAEVVDVECEWQRVDMGVGTVRRVCPDVAVSVDTFRAEIVRRVVAKYGAVIVNDISAGEADNEMIATVAQLDLPYIAMHSRGTPATMQQLTDYKDVVEDVCSYLFSRAEYLESCGIKAQNIILDPGFGFAKSVEQNYQLLAGLSSLCDKGYAVLVGLSRKSMIYKVLNSTPEQSLVPTMALCWEALRQGATILRVHDVSEAVQIVTVYDKGFRCL